MVGRVKQAPLDGRQHHRFDSLCGMEHKFGGGQDLLGWRQGAARPSRATPATCPGASQLEHPPCAVSRPSREWATPAGTILPYDPPQAASLAVIGQLRHVPARAHASVEVCMRQPHSRACCVGRSASEPPACRQALLHSTPRGTPPGTSHPPVLLLQCCNSCNLLCQSCGVLRRSNLGATHPRSGCCERACSEACDGAA